MVQRRRNRGRGQLDKQTKLKSAKLKDINKSLQNKAYAKAASSNPPAVQSGGSGAGKPPTTRTTTAVSGGRGGSTGGRSGKGGGSIRPRTGLVKQTGIPVNGAKGERVIGSGTGTKTTKALPKGSASAGAASKAVGAVTKLSGVLAPVAMAAEVKAIYDFKNDKSRPTVQSHGAQLKKDRAANKKPYQKRGQGRTNAKTIDYGINTKKVVNDSIAATNQWTVAGAGPGNKKPKTSASGTTQTSPKSNTGTRSKRASGPKVGSAQYKANRQAKYEARKAAAFAQTKTGKANPNNFSSYTDLSTGKTKTKAQTRLGNEHRQGPWTNRAQTNKNLQSADNGGSVKSTEGYNTQTNKQVKTQKESFGRRWGKSIMNGTGILGAMD